MIGALKDIYKRGGHPFERKTVVIKEINEQTNTFDLVDVWGQKHPGTPGFTWSNASLKIQCRLDYFFPSRNMQNLISDCQIDPNIFSDHSGPQLCINLDEKKRGEDQGFGNLLTPYR